MINKLAIIFFKLFLYPAVFLRRRFSKAFNLNNQYKNFLFVNTTGIGDTILSTPAWELIRRKFPDAFISILVHERRKDIIANNPFVDNVIIYRKFVYFLRLVKKLRRLKIDVAFIFHGNDPDILPLVFLGGAREIIGYQKRTRMPYFLTDVVYELPHNFIRAQVKLAEALDGKIEDIPFPRFFLNEGEKRMAEVFLEKNGLAGHTLIGILPGAGKPYKCWAPDRFAGLIRHILQREDVRIIIFGSKREMPLAKKIEALSKENEKVLNVSGCLNLREAAAFMERLNLFITNDSGPLHIAVALGVPTVALFCPTEPEGLLPQGRQEMLRIIKKEPNCKPCITKRCRDPICMDQISVDEVLRASENLLTLSKAPPTNTIVKIQS